MTDNSIDSRAGAHGDVVRTYQVLRSVRTRRRRSSARAPWVIDVVYSNQDGKLVAVESYTGFGYQRGRARSARPTTALPAPTAR